jgi:hypothetical protein
LFFCCSIIITFVDGSSSFSTSVNLCPTTRRHIPQDATTDEDTLDPIQIRVADTSLCNSKKWRRRGRQHCRRCVRLARAVGNLPACIELSNRFHTSELKREAAAVCSTSQASGALGCRRKSSLPSLLSSVTHNTAREVHGSSISVLLATSSVRILTLWSSGHISWLEIQRSRVR